MKGASDGGETVLVVVGEIGKEQSVHFSQRDVHYVHRKSVALK